MTTLSEIRDRIDSLDIQISGLLKERLSLAIAAADIKAGIEDKNREADILSGIISNCENDYEIEFLTGVYSQIFRSGKIIMSDHKKKTTDD